MSKNNDRIAKIERLVKRINELVEKGGGGKGRGSDDEYDGSRTKEEEQELVQKQGELERLIKEDDQDIELTNQD